MSAPPAVRRLNLVAIGSLLALACLTLAWELWIAPLRPGGSWLALKSLPLLAALPGLLHARRYTHQWVTLLSMAYLAEGLVRATSDAGPSAALAAIEVLIATILFFACALFARATRAEKQADR